jgi:hypothetical protein
LRIASAANTPTVMAPLLLRALVALMCVVAAAAQKPFCSKVNEPCGGIYTSCCPGVYLECFSGTCYYVRAAAGADMPKNAQQG